jgi:hypothetical protein
VPPDNVQETQDMKVILSRKGFDSASGGCASPIFENDSFLSLPIPEESALLRFSDIGGDGRIGKIVEDLTSGWRKPRKASDHVHLDPDLRVESRQREPGWGPLFGQDKAAQGHLSKHGVGAGDIFLFFGWFRRVEQVDGRFRFKPRERNLHMLYGWLEVGDMWRVDKEKSRIPVWAAEHPHVTAKNYHTNNMIYVAAGTGSTYNAGTFRSFDNDLVLTEPSQSRSRWRLPKWFHPTGRGSRLSCHDKINRWRRPDENYTYLQTVGRGQEFVLDANDYREAEDWAKALIEHHRA